MKKGKGIKEVLKTLDKYCVKNLFAKFECFTEDTAIFTVSTIDYNRKFKYTTDFNFKKLNFTFHVIGLEDIMPSMAVLDLVTNKYVRYLDVSVSEETIDSELSIDAFGFNTLDHLTDESIDKMNELQRQIDEIAKG